MAAGEAVIVHEGIEVDDGQPWFTTADMNGVNVGEFADRGVVIVQTTNRTEGGLVVQEEFLVLKSAVIYPQ